MKPFFASLLLLLFATSAQSMVTFLIDDFMDPHQLPGGETSLTGTSAVPFATTTRFLTIPGQNTERTTTITHTGGLLNATSDVVSGAFAMSNGTLGGSSSHTLDYVFDGPKDFTLGGGDLLTIDVITNDHPNLSVVSLAVTDDSGMSPFVQLLDADVGSKGLTFASFPGVDFTQIEQFHVRVLTGLENDMGFSLVGVTASSAPEPSWTLSFAALWGLALLRRRRH